LLYCSAMPHLAYSATVLLADDPKWTDQWTAYGTVGLAVVTVLGLGLSLWGERRARKIGDKRLREEQERAQEDREAAEQRLREEREESDRRIREERAAADHRQLRERQIKNATELLHRIADLHPYLPVLPLLRGHRSSRDPFADRLAECRDAVLSLQRGAETEVHALHNRQAAELYRTYVQLVLAVREGSWAQQLDQLKHPELGQAQEKLCARIEGDLRRFALYVRLWLEVLIEGDEIPQDVLGPLASVGSPSIPVLGNPPEYGAFWNPQSIPPRWYDYLQLDPGDPQFRPLR